ncbi:hypothetical protein GCM10022220_37930 [Actinocatenispora rupis]|uniref:Uncharacterized protein n=1 Tax=Actinocatenispora rupis TaxID=519421 RepID=A0A8J3J8J4_9ACTN|nr:hypothetical protein Aru02nite_30030 [Actinocatenispora rupis]
MTVIALFGVGLFSASGGADHERVTMGVIPHVGQTVYLGPEASPQFRARPIQLLITAPPQPSTIDAAEHRTAKEARWLLLTGWELDPRGQRVLHRTVSARTSGIAILRD